MNAVEIEEAVSQLVERYAEEGFDAENFPYDFLAAFGNPDTTLKRLRSTGKSSTNQSDIGGVLQTRNIHLKVTPGTTPGSPPHADAERGPSGAGGASEASGTSPSVHDTLRQILDSPETAKRKCKFALATDGVTLEAENLTPGGDGETLACDFNDLPDRFAFFLELAGIRTVKAIRENAFDVKATGRLNKLYVELLRHNPDWGGDDRRQDLNHFFARLIFCFFAEDTGIFGNLDLTDDADRHQLGLFTATVQQMSAPDASNVHEVLAECFKALNTSTQHQGTPDDRYRRAAKIRPYADKLPYVNGGLFGGDAACSTPDDVPRFTKIARAYLLHIGGLDWTKINPDIFGSMIQAVADDAERGALGMHYTSVPNILKVLNPLFLDDLRDKLQKASTPEPRPQALRHLRKRLARIRVFDPACGSGNFLVIAYKQMRQIEAEINVRLGEPERSTDIPLTNFRGIELRHFACEIARLALVIAEYQCDVLHRGQRLALAEFLPLDQRNWITHGNALRIDWLTVCPPTGTDARMHADDLFETPLDQAEIDFENEGGETYICSNPPYVGSTYQTKEQKAEIKVLIAKRSKSSGFLDYVAGWLLKAAEWILHTRGSAAFVTTNSICQGQSVPILWPIIFDSGIEISYAHQSFKWANLASNNAGVTVAIVGLSQHSNSQREITSLNSRGDVVKREGACISPYLIFGSKQVVNKTRKQLCGLNEMEFGNKPSDGGNLLLSRAEAPSLSLSDPQRKRFLRPIYGSTEFIRGVPRTCLWIENGSLSEAMSIPTIAKRINAVKQLRLASPDKGAHRLAKRPHQLKLMRKSTWCSIIIPIHTSANREYLPVGVLDAHNVVTNAAYALYDAPLWNLALIASRLHLVWIATVCGKLKTDYRYSNTLGWNTFPVPALTEQNKADLTRRAEDILLARESYWPATIAEMYDPRKMDEQYPEVRRAHESNDDTLERIYLGRRFKNDTERLEHLFRMYTEMTAEESSASTTSRRDVKE